MKFRSRVLGLEKYMLGTSACNGDIAKNGPSRVSLSIFSARIWGGRNSGDWVSAVINAGNWIILRNASILVNKCDCIFEK